MINVSMTPTGEAVAVYVSQGSIGENLYFIPEFLPPTGQGWSVRLEGTKPSGETFSKPFLYWWTGTSIRIGTTEDMTNEPGIINAQIVFKNGDARIGSQRIRLMVEPIGGMNDGNSND